MKLADENVGLQTTVSKQFSNTNKQLTIQAFRDKIGNLIGNQIAQNEARSCVAGFGLHHHDYGFEAVRILRAGML